MNFNGHEINLGRDLVFVKENFMFYIKILSDIIMTKNRNFGQESPIQSSISILGRGIAACDLPFSKGDAGDPTAEN